MAFRGPTLAELQKRKDPAALQARVQQLAAKPATRKAIPDALLPLAYRKARQAAIFGKQPVVPGSPMTNRDLARESNAAMDVQYGQQRALLQRQQAQAPDYYDAYVRELQKAQDAARTQGTQTGEAIQKLYGSGPMAPGSNQATLGAAQAGTANLLAQVEANHQQALANAVQSGKLRELANIGQKRADLAREEGAANLAYRSKRRSEEMQNVGVSALAGVKQDTAQAAQTQKGLDFLAKTGHTPAYAAAHPGQFAKDQIRRQHQLHPPKTAANTPDAPFKYGYTKKEWLALPLSTRQRITRENAKNGGGANASGKDQYGNTAVQRTARTSDLRRIFRNARQLHAHRPGLGVQDIISAIGPDYSAANADVLTGAVQMATLGHVGPDTANALRRLGVDPQYWGARAPRRRVKRPKPGNGAPGNP